MSSRWEDVENRRWTVGRLRAELSNLPDDMPLLVNVSIHEFGAAYGDDPDGFVPLVVTDGGFLVDVPDEDGIDRPLGIFSLETELGDDSQLVYRLDPEGQD